MTVSDLGFIHQFVPATVPGLPTLLLLHGTGGDENDLLDLGRALLPGTALLSPRGKVSEEGMARFFRRMAEGVFDQEDLRRRTDELATFVAAAAANYGFASNQMIAVGFSNGANIAASLLLRQPAALAGAILLSAMVPFVPATPPDLAGRPIFIGEGRRDPLIPAANAAQLVAILTVAGATVTEHWHDGGHTITPDELRAAQAWLAQTRG
ncbi:MAG: alpha/beta hydrolase [Ktedonobacterales bacterium]|nr:alpha/beta hydrolase [Ktedonobacterales bacterium]